VSQEETRIMWQSVSERLTSFSCLSDGWLDGEGKAPSPDILDLAMSMLDSLRESLPDLPIPSLYPTPEGGIQAEWVIGRWAADLAFDPIMGIEGDAIHLDSGATSAVWVKPAFPSDVSVLADWFKTLRALQG